MSRIALLCSSLLFAAVVTACGPSQSATCGPSTCSGCCDTAGVCHSGTSSDSCGSAGATCSACFGGQQCMNGYCFSPSGGGGAGGGNGSCTPQSCVDQGLNCGTADDGCGGALNCGTCDVSGESCGAGGVPNVCGVGTCSAKTCTQLGANCGSISDGCGTLLNCGTCNSPETCGGGGTANVCGSGCVPKTCADLGKNCGTVSDTCGTNLNCGNCTGTQTCGGGGVANVCGIGCSPKTCTQLGKNCGNVDNGCGTNLNCGSCTSPQTCGGAGTANVCGAVCSSGCPTGFSCDANGVCSGGNLTGLVLNVPVPPLYTVSGTVTVNGAKPTAQSCSYGRATIRFEHTTDSRYDTTHYVSSCTSLSDPFTWSGQLYPGTYKVTVSQYSSNYAGTNLPDWSTVVSTNFTVAGNLSNQVLNVPVPPLYTVSGTVTVNGAKPTAQSCSYGRATIRFEHTTDSRYDMTHYVSSCTSLSDPFTWSGQLYPGTYKVTVSQYSSNYAGTNLPDWSTVVSTNFSVSGNLSNQIFDVPVPPLYTVSGTVTVNGAKPTAQSCSYGRATIRFEHTTDSRYDMTHYVSSCTSLSDPFTWSGQLYPGTYKVTVSQYSSNYAGTNIPDWSTVVSTNFTVSGNMSNQVFNVPVPPLYTVSGTVTVNGAKPTAQSCSYGRATIRFEHTTDSRYDMTHYVSSCTSLSDPFTWSGQLYPGTYKVTVSQYSSNYAGTNLPDWSTVVSTNFTVAGNLSNQVLNVPVPPLYTVSGTVTVNGAKPTAQSCSYGRATIRFEHTTDSRYDMTHYVSSCTSLSDPFTWSGQLYPGTYKVTVSQYSSNYAGTNLPDWSTVVSTNFNVSGNLSNQVLNVPVPPLYTVSGTVTVNGAKPTAQSCSYGRATIRFEHTTDSRYDMTHYVSSCTSLSDPFTFTGQLYPGTYKVTVSQYSSNYAGTNIPDWTTTVVDRLQVP